MKKDCILITKKCSIYFGFVSAVFRGTALPATGLNEIGLFPFIHTMLKS